MRAAAMPRGIAASLVLTSALAPIAVQARVAEAVLLVPTAQWNIDYAADSCKLRRAFGAGATQVSIEFQQRAPNVPYEMMLSGHGIRRLQTRAQLTVGLGQAFTFKQSNFAAAVTADGTELIRFRLFRGGAVDKDDGNAVADAGYQAPHALDPVTYVDLTSGKTALRLATGPLSGAVASLNRCVDDLVRGWGLDPAAQRALTRRVRPASNPALWLDSGDYPAAMLAANRGAIVEFRLMVSATGAVTGCHIQSGLSYAGFEARTCTGISRRARFDPALDAAGNPVASFYINTVRWELG